MKKRGQLKLSFGMIFSIILIIIFIAFAFFAITKFLDIQKSVEVGRFISEFQSDVDRIWSGSQGSQLNEYFLGSDVEYVCIIDYVKPSIGSDEKIYKELEQAYYEKENLFFYPIGSAQGLDAREIKHINIEETTQTKNPLCFRNVKGKTNIRIKKEFGEALVTISE